MAGNRHKSMALVAAIRVVAMILLLGVPCAQATPVVGEFTWDTSGDTEYWQTGQSWTHLSNPGGYLQIDLDPTDPTPGGEWSSLLTVDANRLFAGNWQQRMTIQFDFYAQDYVPGALQLQWQGTSGYTWRYVLMPGTSTGQWSTYSASFGNWENWAFPGATEEMFLSDLSSIDWIGIYIFRSSGDGQTFRLDDFKLMIPEPEEYAMIAAGLIVLLMALRRRRVLQE